MTLKKRVELKHVNFSLKTTIYLDTKLKEFGKEFGQKRIFWGRVATYLKKLPISKLNT